MNSETTKACLGLRVFVAKEGSMFGFLFFFMMAMTETFHHLLLLLLWL